MPPRRGGRGRGMVRPRPPAVIRESMQEIGSGSLLSYEAIARMTAARNASASRAFFPPLRDDQKPKAMPLGPGERCLVKLAFDLGESIGRSPHAVIPRKGQDAGGLQNQLSTLQKYYFGRVKKAGDSSGTSDDDAKRENLWDVEKCWIIPETLPHEIRPLSLRENAKPVRKRRKLNSVSGGPSISDILAGATAQEEKDGQEGPADGKTVEGGDAEEDAEEQNEANEANVRRGEDDDDLELDADYQTGARFDDDDGYEENDSGAEEATF